MKYQLLYLALMFLGMLLSANQHGKPKEGNHNFWIHLSSTLISFYILYEGGFFKDIF